MNQRAFGEDERKERREISEKVKFAYENKDKSEKDIALELVISNGLSLSKLSNTIKDDPKIVLKAFYNNYESLKFASDRLKSDKAFIKDLLEYDARGLEFVPSELKNDKELVFIAVSRYGNMLEYASSNLKKDKTIVAAAVSTDTGSFIYADNSLHKDDKFIESLDFDSSILRAYTGHGNIGGGFGGGGFGLNEDESSYSAYLFDITLPICRKIITLSEKQDYGIFAMMAKFESIEETFRVAQKSKHFKKNLTFDSFINSIVEYEDEHFNNSDATSRINSSLKHFVDEKGYTIEIYTINLINRVINFKKINPFTKKIVVSDESRVHLNSEKIDTIGNMNFKHKKSI